MDEIEAKEAIVVVVEFITRRAESRFSPPFGMAPALRKWRQGVLRNLKCSKSP